MISVLLAAYCGEELIGEQIASILPQLHAGDELILSDDSPEGRTATREVARGFDDPRMAYLQGPRQGVIQNVEFLLGQAKGDILVLSDQDDVWLPDKLQCVRSMLAPRRPALLMHNAKMTDGQLQDRRETLFENRSAGPGFWRNVWRNGYTGCCMAFTRELLPYILPFPAGLPMHDQWIGLRAEQLQQRGKGVVHWVAIPYILYRRHEKTQTGRRTKIMQKIRWRARILRALLQNPLSKT